MPRTPDDKLPLKLLWVDDDPLMRTAIKLAGGDLARHVEVAASGEQARAVLQESVGFDWIVCDYHLRGATSADLLRELVSAGHRVAVVTGDPARVEAPSGVTIFEKPVDLHGMLEELFVLLRRAKDDLAQPA